MLLSEIESIVVNVVMQRRLYLSVVAVDALDADDDCAVVLQRK